MPRLREATAAAQTIDPTLRDRLDGTASDLLFPAVDSGVGLLTAAILGATKPWGRTPYGRKQGHQRGGNTTQPQASAPPPGEEGGGRR